MAWEGRLGEGAEGDSELARHAGSCDPPAAGRAGPGTRPLLYPDGCLFLNDCPIHPLPLPMRAEAVYDYGYQVRRQLRAAGFHADIDASDRKMQKKVGGRGVVVAAVWWVGGSLAGRQLSSAAVQQAADAG